MNLPLPTQTTTVNTITPGFIALEGVTTSTQVSPDMIPVCRYGKAEEVAAVALMLVNNGYITGQNIHVNGGFLMG